MSTDPAANTELWNPDLAPTDAAQRTWRWYHFAALWVGMVMCIPAYTLSASLIEAGMSAYQAVFTVFLANAIVLLPMLLIGHAGTKYGIPYAVLARASFGTRGARLPALMRAVVACEDTSHQAIARLVDGNARRYEVKPADCVGCNLCEITCPVESCITMVPQPTGLPYMNWTQDPRNPRAEVVA